MPNRALIIAIENYTASDGEVAVQLPGVDVAGQQFGEWLVSHKGIRPSDIFICSDGGTYDPAVKRFGVQREQILDAVSALVEAGQDSTDDLYCFYSGHGLMFADSPQRRAVSIALGADFKNAADSGTKCLNLAELQVKLYGILGGKNHYYFIDACRTILKEADIEPVPFGRMLGRPAQRSKPSIYTLYSTKFGEPADIQSPFAAALLDGLAGKGRAKGYVGSNLYVLFPLLAGYVAAHMGGQKIDDSKEGSGDGLILQIVPPPQYTGKVTVLGAAPGDPFVLRRAPVTQPQFARSDAFTGPEFTFDYPPGDSTLDVLENGAPLERVDPAPPAALDFFDTCVATFRRPVQVSPPAPASPTGSVVGRVNLSISSSLLQGSNSSALRNAFRLTSLHSGSVVNLSATAPSASLAAGSWELAVTERGSAVSRKAIDISPGVETALELRPIAEDPIRAAIIAAIPESEDTGPTIDFSESLGPTTDPDLGLWLTLMGAAHIFDGQLFEKLHTLSFDSFNNLAAGDCATYILSALPHDGGVLVSADEDWTPLEAIGSIPSVRHATLAATSGIGTLSFAVGSHEARTITTLHQPNLVTLVVLFNDSSDRLTFAQLLVPIRSLLDELPAEMRDYGQRRAFLPLIRSSYSFQRLFSRGRLLDPPDDEEKADLAALLRGEWVDPITSLIACYDTLRRDDTIGRGLIAAKVLPNLQKLFPDLPDVAAINQLLHSSLELTAPKEPPLFTEALLAFPDWPQQFSYNANRLDYSGVWTTWVSAVAQPQLASAATAGGTR